MPSAEEFMLAYLRERTEIFHNELEKLVAFRQRYYTEQCKRGDRINKLKEIIKEAQSEIIGETSHSGLETQVTTSVVIGPGQTQRLRYHLQGTCEVWLIRCVDIECPSCHGVRGNLDCLGCDGHGWISGNRSTTNVRKFPGKREEPPDPRPGF